MEQAPRGEQLPSPEALLLEAESVIRAEPDPSIRALLYATSLKAGNPEFALDGRAAGNLVNLLPTTPIARAEQPFVPNLGKDGFRLRDLAMGVGVVHSAECDMTDLAGSLLGCAEALYGKHSTIHDSVAVNLLRGGVAGEENALLRHYAPEDMGALRTAEDTHGARDFILALVGQGVDIMDETTPLRYIHDQVWEHAGIDPGDFGYTYFLARAYATAGNAERAYRLGELLHEPKVQLPVMLAVREAAGEMSLGRQADNRIRNIKKEDSDKIPGFALQMAEYNARNGQPVYAREFLRRDDGDEERQSEAWADIYTHTGDGDARVLAVKYWKENFNTREDKIARVLAMATKDLELGRVDPTKPGSTTPLIAWEIANARGNELEEWMPLLYGRLAGHFARTGNAGALADVLDALHGQDIPAVNRVRGFTEAAIGLQCRQRVDSV